MKPFIIATILFYCNTVLSQHKVDIHIESSDTIFTENNFYFSYSVSGDKPFYSLSKFELNLNIPIDFCLEVQKKSDSGIYIKYYPGNVMPDILSFDFFKKRSKKYYSKQTVQDSIHHYLFIVEAGDYRMRIVYYNKYKQKTKKLPSILGKSNWAYFHSTKKLNYLN